MASGKKLSLGNTFTAGIWKENPVFALLLGMCPTLAVTTSLAAALTMGASVLFVLICSQLQALLRIQPLRELETLRGDEIREGRIRVTRDSSHVLKAIHGDTVELSIKIKPTDATEYGVSVFCDAEGNGFPITIKPESGVLAMGDIEPPFKLKPGEDLNLRVFLDRGMVEVFVNGRQAAVYMQPHEPGHVGVSLFSKGSDIMASVKAWPMKSIYETH